MKVSLNFTGRTKLNETEVLAHLIRMGEKHSVSIRWDLSGRIIPKDSYTIVEVFGSGQEKRLEIAGSVEIKGEQNLDISDFRDFNGLRARLKIVRKAEDSNIPYMVFVLDNISVENETDLTRIKSLLPIVKRTDLETPWFLDLSCDEFELPCLLIRENDGIAESILDHPLFAPLVLPAVVSRIFEWAYEPREVEPDSENWEAWKTFFKGLIGDFEDEILELPLDEKTAKVREYSTAIVSTFSLKNDLVGVLNRVLGEIND